jgi:TonB family protein
MLWLLIDETGKARKAVIRLTSGRDALDAVALSVVPSMRFSAAKNNGRKTPVWVQLPVRFRIEELQAAGYD